MLEIFEQALKSPAGSFAFVLALLSISFIAIWKVSHFSTKFKSVEKLEGNIDSIKEDMHYVKAFIQIVKQTENPFAQRQSPVSMTESGKKVFEELEINKLVINHWDEINAEVSKILEKDCNPYDIQVASFKVGDRYQKILTEKELSKVKEHAFSIGYPLDIYNLLFGITIRDKILDGKGFKSKDVDDFDPKSKKQNNNK